MSVCRESAYPEAMRSKARIGVVVALVSASAACSLLTDTSDLSGGARVGDSGIAVDGG
ncbi:MAG: hypothetical protein JWM74_3858, partial [Myxococcaceae bacterium]|nr:hypothetical protein [Myxococcaceae bacterium]